MSAEELGRCSQKPAPVCCRCTVHFYSIKNFATRHKFDFAASVLTEKARSCDGQPADFGRHDDSAKPRIGRSLLFPPVTEAGTTHNFSLIRGEPGREAPKLIVLPHFYPIKETREAESWRIGSFTDSEMNTLDSVILYFQLTAKLPRSKSRVRIPVSRSLSSPT